MLYAYNTPDISGIILGPSKLEQLKDSIRFYQELINTDSYQFYSEINKIRDQIN